MTNYRENFIELLLAKRLGDPDAIHEASLGRIMQHALNVPQVGFAMLTSWRQNLSRKQNLARFTELKNQIRGLGLGFNVLSGHWRECQDPGVPYEDCPEDELVDAVEPSLFVTGITLEAAAQLGNDYNQDAIVYAGPETKGLTSLVFKDGSVITLGKFSPSSVAQAYSDLKGGRTFRFEYLEWPTQGRIESLMEQAYNQNPLSYLLK